ncbi:hypothetical protein GCM10009578_061860 [Streptomyces rhizosphaericus]
MPGADLSAPLEVSRWVVGRLRRRRGWSHAAEPHIDTAAAEPHIDAAPRPFGALPEPQRASSDLLRVPTDGAGRRVTAGLTGHRDRSEVALFSGPVALFHGHRTVAAPR